MFIIIVILSVIASRSTEQEYSTVV